MNNSKESGRGALFMRRAVVMGAVLGFPGVTAYCCIQDGVHEKIHAVLDKDVAAAQEAEKFVDNLEETQKILGELGEVLNVDGEERIKYPVQIVERLNRAQKVVITTNDEVSFMVGKNFKLNSGVLVDDVAQIRSLQVVLSPNKLTNYINRSVREKGVQKEFVNMDEILGHGASLSAELDELKQSLDALSDPNLASYSNNALLNEKNNTMFDNPRMRLQYDFQKMDYALQADYNNAKHLAGDTSREMMPQGCDVAEGGHAFVVKYGFLKMPKDWAMSAPDALEKRGELDVKAYAEVKKFLLRLIPITHSFKETKKPIKGPDVQKLESMLITGGYLDYNHTSGEYDEELHQAFQQFWHDLDFINLNKLEYLEIGKK